MNTYDFDQTIFYPDSSYCFVKYCLKKYPKAVLPAVPGTLKELFVYLKRRQSAKAMKQRMFSFLPRLGDVDAVVRDFWDEYRGNLEPWYLAQKKPDDIIISASPEFLLQPICDELGVSLIATRMDKTSGRIDGENCHDAEKVRRFNAQYPGAHTERFYSDSLADTPMAMLADEAFIVKRGSLSPWPNK